MMDGKNYKKEKENHAMITEKTQLQLSEKQPTYSPCYALAIIIFSDHYISERQKQFILKLYILPSISQWTIHIYYSIQ